MHQNMHALSETQAGSVFLTRVTFACVVSAQRTSHLEPRMIYMFNHIYTILRIKTEQNRSNRTLVPFSDVKTEKN